MRALDLLTLVLAIIGTMIGVALLAFAIVEREPGLIFPALAIAILPWGLWAFVRAKARDQGRKAFEVELAGDFAGAEAQWFKGSGLALDRTSRRLVVGGRDGITVLALSEIASLRYVPPEPGSVGAAGMNNAGLLGVVLAILTIGSATAGHVGSGLFIATSESNRKPLQVFGIPKKDAEAWIAKLTAAAPQIRTEPA